MISILAHLRRAPAHQPSGPRYVRKPKVHRESTYATRATAGRHAVGTQPDQVAWPQLHERLVRERIHMVAAAAVRPARYRGQRRAPAGVATLVRRAHGMARRAPAAARHTGGRVRARVSDLTGEIPRTVRWHGPTKRPWFHRLTDVMRTEAGVMIWKTEASAW